jgi:hypothetical protein
MFKKSTLGTVFSFIVVIMIVTGLFLVEIPERNAEVITTLGTAIFSQPK